MELDKWIDYKKAQPYNGSICEVIGRPTRCCEIDMEEEQTLKCKFMREPSCYKIGEHAQILDLEYSEIFEVMEQDGEEEFEPKRWMHEVTAWRNSYID